jgi:hypothetical protein
MFYKRVDPVYYDWVKEVADRINQALAEKPTDPVKLCELKDDIDHYEWMIRGLRPPYQRIPWGARDVVLNELDAQQDPYFLEPMITTEDETVNGYKLYDSDEPIMWYHEYQAFLELLEGDVNDMTLEEFMVAYNETACTDWCKQDEHGDCLVGIGITQKVH